MKCKDWTWKQEAHGTFEAILRVESLLDQFTCENGATLTLLICGPPGAGKTTLALYFLYDFYQKLGKKPNALLLSLVETPEQIEKICKLYSFDFGTNNRVGVHLVPARFEAGDEPIIKEITESMGLTLKPCDLLLVDGVSILGTQEAHRKGLLSFLDQIKEHKLLTILVAEEYSENEDIFLHYAVDGIIRLSIDPILNSRRIEVSKFRWHDHDLGTHAFRLSASHGRSGAKGVLFFPSINCLIEERIAKLQKIEKKIGSSEVSKAEGLSSGVEGFDQIAKADIKGGPFQPGDQVLLIGPSGSGKFPFGTQFLAAASQGEISVCISFVRTFPEIKPRLSSLPNPYDKHECHCLTFSPTGLVVEEMVGAVHNLLCRFEKEKKNVIIRVFIDGISSLRCLFSTNEKFEFFLLSFLRLLKTFPKVVTLVSYYTPRVFASYAEIDIPAGERFSMIVGFNFQEQHNMLKPGIVILKSRIMKSDKSLKVPVLLSDGKYTVDLKAGWPVVGLLGGEREQVREERPFVKLFFENRSEEEVIKQPFEDFAGRYPGDHIFRMVAKHNPNPKHWSFLGYAGPGHSNTKLVELRKYVMDVLRERNVFIPVADELDQKLKERFEEGFLWNDSTSYGKHPNVMVPFYADVGVLVYQEDALRRIQSIEDNNKEPSIPSTWDELVDMVDNFKPDKQNGIRHLFIIPDTVSDTKNFVSFFFELCWTYGWKFPDSDSGRDDQRVLKELQEWVNGPYFHKAVELLQKMVSRGKEMFIPNPNVGGHYHESIFSRRWFSKIHLLPRDAKNRAEFEKKAFRFGIAPLPGVKIENELFEGISNVDLYSLAIIHEALAPETGWMLVSGLVEKEVIIRRAIHKRGLPISRRMFRTRLIQDNLGSPPPAPEKYPEFYKGQNTLFKKYLDTLNTILDPPKGKGPRFRRTADITHFYHLEELLASTLPRLFDDPPVEEKKVKEEIMEGLERTYRKPGNT